MDYSRTRPSIRRRLARLRLRALKRSRRKYQNAYTQDVIVRFYDCGLICLSVAAYRVNTAAYS